MALKFLAAHAKVQGRFILQLARIRVTAKLGEIPSLFNYVTRSDRVKDRKRKGAELEEGMNIAFK